MSEQEQDVQVTGDDVGFALLELTGLAMYIQETYDVPGITFDSQDGSTCIIVSVDPETTQKIKAAAKELGLDYEDAELGEVEPDGETTPS